MKFCKPDRDPAKVRLLAAVSVAVPLVAFLIATLMESYASFMNMLGLVSLMTGILLNVRFTLTEYEYGASPECFSVVKILGSRRTEVCNIDLSTAIGLYKESDYEHLPASEKGRTKYSLTQNICARDVYVFLCEFNGQRTMIRFEPNGAFVAILRDYIEAALSAEGEDSPL